MTLPTLFLVAVTQARVDPSLVVHPLASQEGFTAIAPVVKEAVVIARLTRASDSARLNVIFATSKGPVGEAAALFRESAVTSNGMGNTFATISGLPIGDDSYRSVRMEEHCQIHVRVVLDHC